jgi:hypothetical protein
MIGVAEVADIRVSHTERRGIWCRSEGMIIKRLFTALAVLALGSALAACSSFAGFVADHWPHVAGGMPNDVPPRPGQPGYDEFIAHRQPNSDAANPAGSDATGQATPSGVQPAPPVVQAPPSGVQAARPAVQAAPASGNQPANRADRDAAAAQGGLY